MSNGSIILRSIYATRLALATITHVLVDVEYGVFLAGLEPLGTESAFGCIGRR